MRILICLLFLITTGCFQSSAQYEIIKSDSLMHLLKYDKTGLSKDRIDIVFELLSRHLPKQPVFDSLANVIITEAETSRNREFMCNVYNRLAHTYLNQYRNHDNYVKGKYYLDRCFTLANEYGLDTYKVSSLVQYASYYRAGTEKQKALNYNNQAIVLATSTGNDSLISESYTAIASTWNLMANNLSRFQSLLTAGDFAEKSGSHNLVTRNAINIGEFYNETEQYEKSKDYYAMAINQAREWKQWHNMVTAMRDMAQAYVAENQKEMGLAWYNKALALCDSLNFSTSKVSLNIDLLNYYMNKETPSKGIAYLNSNPILLRFINDLGLNYQLNKLYAAEKVEKKQYDSALHFIELAAPFEYNQPDNYNEKYNYTIQWSAILKKMGKSEALKQKLLLAKSFADTSGDLNMLQDISQILDSIYLKEGDYKNAFYYYGRYNFYKDTLETLGRQKDLLNIEIANTNKRAEQQKMEEEAQIRKRDNLEYMGITAAIATIFIVLVLFGVFKISPAVIKALGFFAFIFLFEFITLLLDKQIHELTHGEPWKVLAIKIILIAMLLPLHHWLEEKVLHYLTSKAHKLKTSFNFLHRHSTEKIS